MYGWGELYQADQMIDLKILQKSITQRSTCTPPIDHKHPPRTPVLNYVA